MKKTIKKAVKKPVNKQATVIAPDIMGQFLKALAELYPSDETAPGIVIAYIPDRKQFYASVVRYEGNMGIGKKVLVSSYADTPRAAFSAMAKQWVEGTVNVRVVRKKIRTAYDVSDFYPWGDD